MFRAISSYRDIVTVTDVPLPLLPQSLRKIVFQVSNPSPHTLFEKQNISDCKSCHQSHTRTEPQSLTRAGRLPTPASSLWELCFRKHSKPKLKALSPSRPVPQQGCSPLQNPDIGTESSRFQPSARPGGRSRSRSAGPGTGKCRVKASKCNTPRGKIN